MTAPVNHDEVRRLLDRCESEWPVRGGFSDEPLMIQITSSCRALLAENEALARKVREMGSHADTAHRYAQELDKTRAEVEALRKLVAPVPEGKPGIAWCPQCGAGPTCDEDGCCDVCGCDVGIVPDFVMLQNENEALRARKARVCPTCLGRAASPASRPCPECGCAGAIIVKGG